MGESDDAPFLADSRGTRVRVLVVPNASRAEIVGRHGNAVKIRVTAPAEGGRANRAVIRLIADRCGAPVELTRGGASRHKVVLVVGKTPEEVVGCLASTRAE